MDKAPKATGGESVPEHRRELPSDGQTLHCGPDDKLSATAIQACSTGGCYIADLGLARHAMTRMDPCNG